MNMPSNMLVIISKLLRRRGKRTNTASELKEKHQRLAGSRDIDNFISSVAALNPGTIQTEKNLPDKSTKSYLVCCVKRVAD